MLKKSWSKFVAMTGKKPVQWALRIYAALFPLILFFALESLNPASAAGLMAQPFSTFVNFGLVFLSVLFIAICAMVFFAFTRSVFWSFVVVSAALGIAYIVNNLKLMITGQVFVPTDLFIAGEALQITQNTDFIIEMTLVLRVLFIILMHLPLFFVKFKPSLKKRGIMLGSAATAFVLVFVSGFYAGVIMPSLDINPRGSLTALYRDTGLILGFHAALVDHNTRNAQAGSASQMVQESTFWQSAIMSGNASHNVQPNVIVIMSEAFMDPTIIYNLEFSTDPVSNLRRLSRYHISGDVIVPVFGGRTANTEFEFLTGSPIFLMGSAYYVPYSNVGRYFFRDINTSMPWLFRHNGYRTVAVHPFSRYFFSRNLVYPRLGFQEFIGYEDMEDPVYKGFYVSDEFFTDQIIDQILLAEQTAEPLFLFGISMQNHWEYWPSKYYDWPQDITSYSPYLTEIELASIDAFLQGIYDADKQLGRLIDFIEGRGTPTIVVFFGDHMPFLGNHGDTFLERLGFISDQRPLMWNEDDRRKMFSVPYLVWSNFAPADEDWGTLSTYFLGARVLAHSGIDLNRYWHYVLHANRYFSALTENHYVDIYGNFHEVEGIMEHEHVKALDALMQVKWFGTDDFHYSLSEIK